MAIANFENRFLFIIFSDFYLIIGINEIELSKMSSSMELT